MKKTLIWLIPALILVGLVVWRFATRGAAERALGQQGAARRGMSSNVEVATATKRTIVNTLESVGNVESPYKVQISAKTAGRIEFLVAREGDPVIPGQVLVTIDKTELQGAVLQQMANVAEARSRLAQALLNRGPTVVGVSSQIQQQQATLTSARADLNQVQKNYNSQIAAAKSQVTDADAKVRAAESQVNNAEAIVTREKANLQNAQTRFDRTMNLYNQKFIAAQDVDDAKAALAVAQGALQVAQGQLAASKQAVTSAQAQKSAAQNQESIAAQKGQADIAASRAKVIQAAAGLNVAIANKVQTPAFQQNIAALQAAVRAAQAQQKQAQARLNDTILKSPIKGTVTARKADVGNLATPSQPILEVQYLEWLYVTTTLPVEQSANVHEGQSAKITFDSLPNRVFTGPIKNVNFAADPTTRQFSIRVRVDNKSHEIRPGMYARIQIETEKIPDAVVIPREAIKATPKGSAVTVVGTDNVAHVITVRTGASDSNGVQILEGVNPGDKVVVLSYALVREGQKVTVAAARPQGQGRTAGGQGRRRQQQ